MVLYGTAFAGRLQGPGGIWSIPMLAAAGYYAGMTVWMAFSRGPYPVPLGLLLTRMTFGSVVASQTVSFPRQVYPTVVIPQ